MHWPRATPDDDVPMPSFRRRDFHRERAYPVWPTSRLLRRSRRAAIFSQPSQAHIEGYCFGDMFEELLGVFERKSPSKARLLDGIEGRPSLRKRVTSTSLSSELSRNMSDPT